MIELDELRTRQAWSFEKKLLTTQAKIMQACKHTDFKIAVSFSGGKDSAVLLDQVGLFWSTNREKHNNSPLTVLFANTKNEFSGMISYIKEYCRYIANKHKIEIDLRTPSGKHDFVYVVTHIGYPVGSKKISRQVRDIRAWMKISGVEQSDIINFFEEEKQCLNELKESGIDKELAKTKAAIHLADRFREFDAPHGVTLYLTGIKQNNRPSWTWRLAEKWRPLLWAPFECSEECCSIIKKSPIKQIEAELNLSPIIGEMADDGNARETAYLKTECNAFKDTKVKSKPMGFWLEQDVLEYIDRYKIPIFKIYGTLVKQEDGTYKFTGEQRTGCKLCMFGIQFPGRKEQFQRLAETEPNTVMIALKDIEDGGFGYGKVITYLNKYCKCKIDISGLYEESK